MTKLTTLKKISTLAQHGRTFHALVDKIPNDLWRRLTAKELVGVLDLMYNQKIYGENQQYQGLK